MKYPLRTHVGLETVFEEIFGSGPTQLAWNGTPKHPGDGRQLYLQKNLPDSVSFTYQSYFLGSYIAYILTFDIIHAEEMLVFVWYLFSLILTSTPTW